MFDWVLNDMKDFKIKKYKNDVKYATRNSNNQK